MASETQAAASEHAVGMPQLDFATFPNQIFWLMVTLVAIFFILNRIVIPRIAGVLADRHDTIQRDLEKAEELKKMSVEAEEAYNKALADARVEASNIVAETKADIQKDLNKAIAKADAQIAAKAAEGEVKIKEIRDDALRAVQKVASDTANEIVKAVMPAASDAKAVKAAVTARLKG
ncbi:MAG: F0F1 ATP synthase subunit B' [Amylibacter sp.]|nr:F0F1 ATP synthase subunit B' [Amylibacter sp.]